MAVVELHRGDDGVAEIVLNRPDHRNAVDFEFAMGLRLATEELIADPPRAVLMRAEGTDFGVGGDLAVFREKADELPAHVGLLTSISNQTVLNFDRMRAPVVTAVQGAAAGGGFGFALCGDILIAGRSARFRSAYTKLGLTPDLGLSVKLERRIGYGRALDVILTDRIIDAETALAWGLAARVVEDADLLPTAREMVRVLAERTEAIGELKSLLRRVAGAGLEAGLADELKTMTSLAPSAVANLPAAHTPTPDRTGAK